MKTNLVREEVLRQVLDALKEGTGEESYRACVLINSILAKEPSEPVDFVNGCGEPLYRKDAW